MFSAQVPMVSPEALPIPMAILSIDDGVVVFTNAAFKKILRNCPVGQPMQGFLHTEASRKSVLAKIDKYGQFSFVNKKKNKRLRFNITREIYSDSPHFFVCIERLGKEENANSSANTFARSDELTCMDRSAFTRQVSDLLSDQQNQNSEQCLCCVDIDLFRIVNEKYGYKAGDYVLGELVKILQEQVPNAVIGKLGSNEFGILIENTSIENGMQICEKICKTVNEHVFSWDNNNINITVSIGVIAIRKTLDDLDFVLGSVDIALRTAQENGRNCVHSSSMQDTMMSYHADNMHYALVIEDALQNNKFQLYAQPIVELSNPSAHKHYEILLRSYDPKLGEFISSQELISAAESLEVTTKIDQWVCENVFKALGEKANQQLPMVSINLSGHSIVNPSFEKYIKELFEKYKVPTDKVCFEITESVAVKSISRAQKFIENLREIGVRFSLDDFGVGYCSFNYLQKLNVDNVKIDGAFVSTMLDNATQFAMVKAITDVARAMNIKTTAEYVEKPEIIKALTVIGVDYGQGYIFGKPSPMKDIL